MASTVPELMAAVATEIDNLIEVDLLQDIGAEAHEAARESGDLEAWRVKLWETLLQGIQESRGGKQWRGMITIH